MNEPQALILENNLRAGDDIIGSNAELYIIPGQVDHEIFVNECNDDGKDEFPEACIDAPGVDRAQIHQTIGNAALKFLMPN